MFTNTKIRGFIAIPILIAILIGTTAVAGAGGYYVATQMQNIETEKSFRVSESVTQEMPSDTDVQNIVSTSTATTTEPELNDTINKIENTAPSNTPAQQPPVQTNEPQVVKEVHTPPVPVIDYEKLCTVEAEKVYKQALLEVDEFTKQTEADKEAKIDEIDELIKKTQADQRSLVSDTRAMYDSLISNEESYYEDLIQAAKFQNINSGIAQYSPSSASSNIAAIESERDSMISDYENEKEKTVDKIRTEADSTIEQYEDVKENYESQMTDLVNQAKNEALVAKNEHYQSCKANR